MLERMVELYIQLRDKKAELKKDYDARVAEIDARMDRCEQFFLKKMREDGLTSLPTAVGVPYIQHRRSYSPADWEGVLGFIKEHGLWQMLEKRLNKTAVEEYREAHDDLPPGVNCREEIVVNVRRAA